MPCANPAYCKGLHSAADTLKGGYIFNGKDVVRRSYQIGACGAYVPESALPRRSKGYSVRQLLLEQRGEFGRSKQPRRLGYPCGVTALGAEHERINAAERVKQLDPRARKALSARHGVNTRQLYHEVYPAQQRRFYTGGEVKYRRLAPLDKIAAHHGDNAVRPRLSRPTGKISVPVVKRVVFGDDAGCSHIRTSDKKLLKKSSNKYII